LGERAASDSFEFSFGHAEDENFAQYSRLLLGECIETEPKGDVLTSLGICLSLMNPSMKKNEQNDFVQQGISNISVINNWKYNQIYIILNGSHRRFNSLLII
jgi:vacuolar-type H+-ATPase subunit B/Vma2